MIQHRIGNPSLIPDYFKNGVWVREYRKRVEREYKRRSKAKKKRDNKYK